MLRGLYSATSGMMCEGIRQHVLADNLANVDTAGHKKQKAVFRSYPTHNIQRIHDRLPDEPPFVAPWDDPYLGDMGTCSVIEELYTDMGPGRLKYTGEDLHIAIDGPGYFLVKSPQGYRMSKDGSFHLDRDGRVMNSSSNPLMVMPGRPYNDGTLIVDENGTPLETPFQELYVNPIKDILIDEEGQVWEDTTHIGTIVRVKTDDTNTWRKEVNSHFNANGRSLRFDGNSRVQQGNLEMSNVNAITQMVEMIECHRYYEMNQRVVTSHDQTFNSLFRIAQMG